MAIILVDRNVVSACGEILNSLQARETLSMKNTKREIELRELDSSSNQISSFLSIVEGSTGIDESPQEKENTLEHEVYIIQKYFTKAETDGQYLLDKKKEISELFSNNYIEENGLKYQKFIYDIQSLLLESVSKLKRFEFLEKILKLAYKYNVNQKHPIVICSIAVLYGNNEVRRVFKFKKKCDEETRRKDSYNVYNVYNDLMIISRVRRIKQILKDSARKDEIKYFSFDKPLNDLVNSLIINQSKIEKTEDGGSILELEINYAQIFTHLSDEEINELMKIMDK